MSATHLTRHIGRAATIAISVGSLTVALAACGGSESGDSGSGGVAAVTARAGSRRSTARTADGIDSALERATTWVVGG